MKKLLATLVTGSAMLASSSAFAGNGAGCGLGKLIFEGKSGLLFNVLAATTNGSSYSQTGGLTSGTSGCDASATVKLEQEQTQFIVGNQAQLMNDVARAQGEYLMAYGRMLGCSAEGLSAFAVSLQANADNLISASEAQAVLQQTKQIIQNNPILQNSCIAG